MKNKLEGVKVGDLLSHVDSGYIIIRKVKRITKTLAIMSDSARIRICDGFGSGSSSWVRECWDFATDRDKEKVRHQKLANLVKDTCLKSLSTDALEKIYKIIEDSGKE